MIVYTKLVKPYFLPIFEFILGTLWYLKESNTNYPCKCGHFKKYHRPFSTKDRYFECLKCWDGRKSAPIGDPSIHTFNSDNLTYLENKFEETLPSK